MIDQKEWLRTRQNLLNQMKAQVRLRLGPMPPALRQYAKSLDGDFRGAWRSCSMSEFRRRLRNASVILGADFHAYAQSQRAHVRILRDLLPRRPVILGLECLGHEHEALIAEFLSGRISEAKFLKQVEWEKRWGFPWENYRPFFELARERGLQIRGFDRRDLSDLNRRDAWTAKWVGEWRKREPEALIYVIIGEWHLARRHLPRLLERREAKDAVVILHQDVEPLYFKLARLRRENTVEYLKGTQNRFCLMVSPPWMKWQSYLMYLEQAYDRDLEDDPTIDYTDHVVSLIELLEGDLKIRLPKADVQVFCSSSKMSLAKLRARLPRRFEKALLHYLSHDQSFMIPSKGLLYLSRPTINHASALAGLYVHAQLCGRKRTLWHMPEDFLALIWVEAVAFFFSKWINPKRKPETLDSVRLRLEATAPKDKGREALLLALDHRLTEVMYIQTGRLRKRRYKPRSAGAYLEASRLVGSMLGERLFQKVQSRALTHPALMRDLKTDVEHADFSSFYWRITRELD